MWAYVAKTHGVHCMFEREIKMTDAVCLQKKKAFVWEYDFSGRDRQSEGPCMRFEDV